MSETPDSSANPGEPTPPAYPGPATPPYVQPATPTHGQPPTPAYGQPAPPAYGQPAPQYEQPQYGQPAPQYGQPAYGAYGQPTYGAPAYGGYPGAPKPNHPQSTTAMVLGIVGLVGGLFCGIGLLAAPFAWVLGQRAKKQIDAEPDRYEGRGQAVAGQVMGIIGTVFLVLAVIAIIVLIIVAINDPNFDCSDSSC
ncbi:MAG TPA: DUF4190 domain-containing protein [Marmoricola sp.]|jgi:hypothetical protein|nr:DUF4190 domain-containing protein [Marmoricola sp.]